MLNIFQNRAVSKKFVEISTGLKGKEKKKFSGYVRALFVHKSTSEEGRYDEFKITLQDLTDLQKQI